MNGADLRRASHEEAVAALRRPCSRVAVKVLRRVETDAGWSGSARPRTPARSVAVELRRKAGRGLGFSVAGKRSALQYSRLHACVAFSLHVRLCARLLARTFVYAAMFLFVGVRLPFRGFFCLRVRAAIC